MECSTYHSNRSSRVLVPEAHQELAVPGEVDGDSLEVMVPVQEPAIERLDESLGRP